MNKKFLLAWGVVFVVWMAGSFVIHGVLLMDGYSGLPNLYRTEEDTASLSHFMLLAHVIMAGAFVWIYQRGHEDKPWLAQGVRFGLAIALLGPISMYTVYYVVQPMPGSFVVQQIIYDAILVIILGVVAAFISKPGDPTPAS